MQTKYFHKIDAQHIVEYVLGDSGDGIFVSPFHDPSSIKTYRILVSSRPDDYESEVALDYSIEKENIILQINGKADGAYSDEGVPTIELIRYSTVPVHEVSEKSDPTGWSLIRCLGFIYAEETGKRSIGLRLTAFHRSASAAVSFIATVKRSELKKDFDSLIEKYLVWVKKLRDRQNDRNVSIVNMPFPYPEKREGQDEFMIASEQVIDAAIKGFIQAPTGIGKTTGSIFPAVKALGKGTVEKIFFLTARTISRTVAEQAFEAIRKAGCKLKTLTITAKEKVCAFPENYCRPEKCPYMRGYHDRAYKAIEEMFQYDHFNRELISVYAHKFKVCPFELSLDLSLWVDGIICDYNYVFDPGVYLKRYFEEGKGEYLFLIDEAHNLVERARDMFSAVLRISRFKAVRKILRKEHVLASHDLDEVLRNFKRIMEECEEAEKILLINKKQDKDIIPAVKDFLKSLEDIMDREEHMENRDAMTDLYYDCLKYIRVSEEFDDNYVSYMGRPEEESKEIVIKLFCLDPSVGLKKMMDKGRAAVIFSATLSPTDYFFKLLGGGREDQQLAITSPFPRKNLCLMVADSVNTKYAARESTYHEVTAMIHAVVTARKGNYIAYFPSYKYMNAIHDLFRILHPDIKTTRQVPRMSELDKESFLQSFSSENEETLAGFAVMGGMFGESIDLTGDRLSGAIIVGVGLPQICAERDIIKAFFDEKYDAGFEYAYIYPGMNKVLQAAGRVIRTEKDRGVVLLLDQRFGNESYRRLFPSHWNNPLILKTTDQVGAILKEFW